MATPEEAVVTVAGLARCGSSLLLQMLDAGGHPVVGEGPAYEGAELAAGLVGWRGWPGWRGRAAKILDAPLERGPTPEGPQHAILLTRALHHQARSHAKMAAAMFGVHLSREDRRRWLASLRRDGPRLAARLRARGPVTWVRFEELVTNPRAVAERLARVLPLGPELDVEAMVAEVIPRSPACLEEPLEWELMRRHDARRARQDVGG